MNSASGVKGPETYRGMARKRRFGWFMKSYQYYILILPAFIWYAIFQYAPLYGIQIAFKNFTGAKSIIETPWVGLRHFRLFFGGYYFKQLLWNTVSLSLYSLIVGAPIPIILALMLNEVKNQGYKKTIQTIIYAPHFISTVVLVGIIIIMFSPSIGVINAPRRAMGLQPYYYMSDPNAFPHIYVWSGIWQNMGWNSIIYVAALAGINPELHEAATIDGASRMQRIRYINIPTIIPTFTILLILSVGSIMNVSYEKVYLMQNDMIKSVANVISTYVYERGLLKAEYSFGAAVGLFNNVVNFVLLLGINWIAGKIGETSLF